MSIPAELQAIPQWLLWKLEHRGNAKPDKVPYSAHTGHMCDPTDPANLAPYASVYNGNSVGYSGVGFSVQEGDGLTLLDFDNPFQIVKAGQVIELSESSPEAKLVANSQQQMIKYLDSYTERSPSGKGFRVILKGKLPAEWGNRSDTDKVEIYGRKRYLTITGDHVEGTPLTINERQPQLEYVAQYLKLHEKRVAAVGHVNSIAQTQEDEDVIRRCADSAKNGEAFTKLWQGDISDNANDQSRAELALANFIVARSYNFEQSERIFRLAPLTQRAKVHDRPQYVKDTIVKAFDMQPPPINITIQREVAEKLAAEPEQEPEHIPTDTIDRPEGLLGLVADFIYYSAPHPIAEFAVAGAIGLLSGICGRAYNINGDGLNQYVAMIGRSAIGKDAVPSGIAKLIALVEEQVPSARHFLGPRSIQSMQALRRTFDTTKNGTVSYVSIINELGEWLAIHSDPKADATKKALMGDVMSIYTQSGKGQEGGSLAYADTDKNVAICKSPSLSLIGDTVAGSFYEACTARNISKGLIPRFTIIEYRGPKPPLNEGMSTYQVNSRMLDCMRSLVIQAHKQNESNRPIEVAMTAEAQEMLRAFTSECLNLYNDSTDDAKGAIYGRAAVKAKKLAALVAVGINWVQPCVTADHAAYGIKLARADIRNLVGRIDSGEIDTHTVSAGGDDPRLKTIAREYLKHVGKPFAKLNKQWQDDTSADLHDSYKVVKLSRLRNLCLGTAAFKNAGARLNRAQAATDFNNLIKDVENIMQVRKVSEIASQDGGALQRWQIDGSTEFVMLRDLDKLKRLAGLDG